MVTLIYYCIAQAIQIPDKKTLVDQIMNIFYPVPPASFTLSSKSVFSNISSAATVYSMEEHSKNKEDSKNKEHSKNKKERSWEPEFG